MLAAPYLPRRPHATVLYALVKDHLEDFLEHARSEYTAPLPRYVEEEFRKYLACGDFDRGFVVVHCAACDEHFAVGFSCKNRSVCPSCAGRRMAGEAAFLVDSLIPNVPLRQYVLAFPYDVSAIAASRPKVLTYLSRVFWEALRKRYAAWAKTDGVSSQRVETGAVTGVHRAGSSLNLHVHFHVLCADGVYLEDHADGLRFVEAPPPTREELQAMVVRIHMRVMRWLKKRGFVREEEDTHEESATTPAEALVLAAMQSGTLVTLRDGRDPDDDDDADLSRPPSPVAKATNAVVFERFNLHATVRIPAGDDVGRERLCRYIARPPFALERFRRLRDGNIAYRVKKVSRHRTTERVMSPVECLARLASIIAPPRYPLLRLHGVFGPRHRWRPRVIPRPPAATAKRCASHHDANDNDTRPPDATRERPHVLPSSALDALAPIGAGDVAPNVLTLGHWQRLEQGALFAATSRIDWRSLLRRTFQVDLRTCARCGARLHVRVVINAPDDIARVLEPLRRSRDPPA